MFVWGRGLSDRNKQIYISSLPQTSKSLHDFCPKSLSTWPKILSCPKEKKALAAPILSEATMHEEPQCVRPFSPVVKLRFLNLAFAIWGWFLDNFWFWKARTKPRADWCFAVFAPKSLCSSHLCNCYATKQQDVVCQTMRRPLVFSDCLCAFSFTFPVPLGFFEGYLANRRHALTCTLLGGSCQDSVGFWRQKSFQDLW